MCGITGWSRDGWCAAAGVPSISRSATYVVRSEVSADAAMIASRRRLALRRLDMGLMCMARYAARLRRSRRSVLTGTACAGAI